MSGFGFCSILTQAQGGAAAEERAFDNSGKHFPAVADVDVLEQPTGQLPWGNRDPSSSIDAGSLGERVGSMKNSLQDGLRLTFMEERWKPL